MEIHLDVFFFPEDENSTYDFHLLGSFNTHIDEGVSANGKPLHHHLGSVLF